MRATSQQMKSPAISALRGWMNAQTAATSCFARRSRRRMPHGACGCRVERIAQGGERAAHGPPQSVAAKPTRLRAEMREMHRAAQESALWREEKMGAESQRRQRAEEYWPGAGERYTARSPERLSAVSRRRTSKAPSRASLKVSTVAATTLDPSQMFPRRGAEGPQQQSPGWQLPPRRSSSYG